MTGPVDLAMGEVERVARALWQADGWRVTPDDRTADVYRFNARATIAALSPDQRIADAVKAERERCARIVERFPLAEDHPDAGVLGCRDMEIAAAIRQSESGEG